MLAGQVACVLLDSSAQFDWPDPRPVLRPCRFRVPQVSLGQIVITARCRQGGADLGIGESAGNGGIATVPQLGHEIGSFLLDEEFHKRARVEVDDRQVQRRCSLTNGATGRRARTRLFPLAWGRSGRWGRPMTPWAARRSSVAVRLMPSNRATGTPRSVTTISSPSRARSNQWLRWVRRVVTATSISEVYSLRSHNSTLPCLVGLLDRHGVGGAADTALEVERRGREE